MDRELNRNILNLSLPSILANLSVPLVGMVDTVIAGHVAGTGAASLIGAISVGAMLFNLLYWNFGFLRTGTGGLTAQSFGKQDMHSCAMIFSRGIVLSVAVSAVILLLRHPFLDLALLCVNGSPEVEELSSRYFLIRVWAAPATLSLMTFSGWFVGMQDTVSSMWKDIVVASVNVLSSSVLSLGACGWPGLGFTGISIGTVIAQYSGLIYCIIVLKVKYSSKVFSGFGLSDLRLVSDAANIRSFFSLNLDLFGRSLLFILIYIGYTMIAAGAGDVTLACSSIIMQLLMLFSYFTDGFAYAGEALSGKWLGARNPVMFRKSVRYVFVWSMSISVLFVIAYAIAGKPVLGLLTDDPLIVDSCSNYLPWLLLMPPLGCAAFTWDGIYTGCTASRDMFYSMLGAGASFCIVWFFPAIMFPKLSIDTLNLLLAAYFAHLLFRTVWLSHRFRSSILVLLSLK